MRIILAFIRVVLCLALATLPAQSYMHGLAGAPPPSSCNLSVLDNGCSGANFNSSFQQSDATFRATAVDDGQPNILGTYTLNKNRAGIEYPVGRDKTLPLKDPTTMGASVPGCSYSAVGVMITGGAAGPQVTCNPNNGDITLNSWDWSGDSSPPGTGCITLRIGGFPVDSTHTLFFTNNKTRYGTGHCVDTGSWIKKDFSDKFDAQKNDFDGNYIALANIAFVQSDLGSGENDWFYNKFINIGGRIGGSARGFGPLLFDYNWIDGYGLGTVLNHPGNLHGELFLNGGQGGPIKFGANEFRGNTLIMRAAQFPGGGQFSSNAYCNTGGPVNPATSCVLDGNTFIVNRQGDGSAYFSTALFQMAWDSADLVQVTNNDVYPSGAFSCGVIGQANNIQSGSSVGNVITITSHSLPLTVGYVIAKTGFTPAHILAYGSTIDPATGQPTTGTGANTGTYGFDGPAQTQAQSNAWVITPPVVSTVTSGNRNLVNGEDMNPNSTQWGAVCTGHHP